MTIQEFIEKHSLSPVQIGPVKPAPLVNGEEKDADRFDDTFEFYSNPGRTIWVSMNRTRNRFRIVFHDLVSIYSDWRSAAVNYEQAPLIDERQHGQ